MGEEVVYQETYCPEGVLRQGAERPLWKSRLVAGQALHPIRGETVNATYPVRGVLDL